MKNWKQWRSEDLKLIRKIRRYLDDLANVDNTSITLKKLAKRIEELYVKLYGNNDIEPNVEDIRIIIPALIAGSFNVIHRLILALDHLDFETKKRVAAVVNFVIRRSSKNHYYSYLEQNYDIISTLLRHFDDNHSAHRSILIEMCKRREIAQILLNDSELLLSSSLLPQIPQSTTILQTTTSTTNPIIQCHPTISNESSIITSKDISSTQIKVTSSEDNEEKYQDKKTKTSRFRFGFLKKNRMQTSTPKEKYHFHRVDHKPQNNKSKSRVRKNRWLKWMVCGSNHEWSSSQSTMDISNPVTTRHQEDSISISQEDNPNQEYPPNYTTLENLFHSPKSAGDCSVADWVNCHPNINLITANYSIVATTNTNICREECCINHSMNHVGDVTSDSHLITTTTTILTTVKTLECGESNSGVSHITPCDIISEMFRHSDNAEFTISRDAYTIVEIFVMRHCDILYRYAKINSDLFLKHISRLIQSTNYLTQRSYIKLWTVLLLKPQFRSFLTQYANDWNNLKIIMQLLRHQSKVISVESFRLFQIFVFNPYKHKQIHIILWNNKNKLIRYLENFHPYSNGGEFEEDKKRVVGVLSQLEKPVCDDILVT